MRSVSLSRRVAFYHYKYWSMTYTISNTIAASMETEMLRMYIICNAKASNLFCLFQSMLYSTNKKFSNNTISLICKDRYWAMPLLGNPKNNMNNHVFKCDDNRATPISAVEIEVTSSYFELAWLKVISDELYATAIQKNQLLYINNQLWVLSIWEVNVEVNLI